MDISLHKLMNDISSKSSVLIEIDDDTRRKLMDVLTNMMIDIHTVCEKNNIGYALGGGSALGAVRHKGYIPWDDDLDISMLRNDYNKFKEVFEKELGNKYILEAPNYGSGDSKLAFPKIYKRGTALWEVQDINVPYEKGIFIDLFVYENVSKSKFVRKVDASISDFMKAIGTSILYYKYPSDFLDEYFSVSLKANIYYKLRKMMGFMFGFATHRTWMIWFDKFTSRHGESDLITTPTGRANYAGEIIPRSYWTNTHLAEFDGHQFYISDDVHAYLRHLYGDSYMQLPPIENRERHFVVKLDFGENSDGTEL